MSKHVERTGEQIDRWIEERILLRLFLTNVPLNYLNMQCISYLLLCK